MFHPLALLEDICYGFLYLCQHSLGGDTKHVSVIVSWITYLPVRVRT